MAHDPEGEKVPASGSASTHASSTTAEGRDVEHGKAGEGFSLWQYLQADVDPKETIAPLAAFSFMTGYIDVISFSAIFVWCGFQTGNFAQLGLAIARLWEGGVQNFRIADQQALCSLIAFNLGAALGRIGDKVGAQKRIWLFAGTFIQALLTMAGAIAFWKSGQPSLANERDQPAWSNALSFVGLAFISASLGLQGVLGKRLNTAFGTTIVLTTVWVELMTDPSLLKIHKKVLSRDHRLIAAVSLFLGAFIGRAILAALGTAGTLGVGVGLRVLIALSWVFVPQKPKTGAA
ncbi:hypothetical protein EST38_g12522 [Candolleomyces aberdarensis]|uniref:DUF1275 domain protein n=1 Tax=Candolleomyces aberdarensis TaxID=2316362 RepID=A0A4V1Q1Z7_9AGAR|nr:hypothetical protein EST38_g12522 [Candolleomyces aberdarensis]